jgi:hypothetical protein
MLLPTLPVYANQLGGSDTAAGLVVGVFIFTLRYVILSSDIKALGLLLSQEVS